MHSLKETTQWLKNPRHEMNAASTRSGRANRRDQARDRADPRRDERNHWRDPGSAASRPPDPAGEGRRDGSGDRKGEEHHEFGRRNGHDGGGSDEVRRQEPWRITSARIPCRWRCSPAASPGGCCAAATSPDEWDGASEGWQEHRSATYRLRRAPPAAREGRRVCVDGARDGRRVRRRRRAKRWARYAASARETVSDAAEAARVRR